jgi:hypothetical protein
MQTPPRAKRRTAGEYTTRFFHLKRRRIVFENVADLTRAEFNKEISRRELFLQRSRAKDAKRAMDFLATDLPRRARVRWRANASGRAGNQGRFV